MSSKRARLSKRGVSPLPVIDPNVSVDELEPAAALLRALEIADPPGLPRAPRPETSTQRTITRRGVLWIGQTCNLRCYFCYYLDRITAPEHPEHPFMSLEKAKKICRTLVDRFGNDAIDIQGGEPTIWQDILPLVRYCHEIGLEPTLITNALVLDRIDVCRSYQEAGLRDFLISVHGIGEVHDRVVQYPGAHVKQMKAVRNLRELGIPFRFNCVLSKPVVNQLPQIAELAVRSGARVVNFLAFNPFEDQAQGGKRSAHNVPRYDEVGPRLDEALDILDAGGVEGNVRYYPLCTVAERHRKSMYGYQQLPYDHHEWDYASWSWTELQPQRMKEGDVSPPPPLSSQRLLYRFREPVQKLVKLPVIGQLGGEAYAYLGQLADRFRDRDALYRENARMRAEEHYPHAFDRACSECSVRSICDGFPGNYASIFGTSEARPARLGRRVDDPTYYIRRQHKVVD